MLGYIQNSLFFHPFLWSGPMVIYRHSACKRETVENWVTSLPRFTFWDASLAGIISHTGLFILQKSANTTTPTSRLVYLFIYNVREEPAVGWLPSGQSAMYSRHFTVCNGHSTTLAGTLGLWIPRSLCPAEALEHLVVWAYPWTLNSSTGVQGARRHIWAVGCAQVPTLPTPIIFVSKENSPARSLLYLPNLVSIPFLLPPFKRDQHWL